MTARDILPWPPEVRERVRQELRLHPLRMVSIGPVEHADLVAFAKKVATPTWNGMVLPFGPSMEIVPRRGTVLGEERRARCAQVGKLCRKCKGQRTRRHHAMCPRRGGAARHNTSAYEAMAARVAAEGRKLLERTSVLTAAGADLDALADLHGIKRQSRGPAAPNYTVCAPLSCEVSVERKAPALRLCVVEVEGVELPVREVAQGEAVAPTDVICAAPDGGRFVVGVDHAHERSFTRGAVYENGQVIGVLEDVEIDGQRYPNLVASPMRSEKVSVEFTCLVPDLGGTQGDEIDRWVAEKLSAKKEVR